MKKKFYLFSLASLFTFPLFSQVSLVKDLNPGIEDGFDEWNYKGALLNGQYILPAKNETTGLELYAIQNNNLTLIKDIVAGKTSSSPKFLTAFNNKIYFIATNESGTDEIWVTDGTANGTIMVTGGVQDETFAGIDNLIKGNNNKLYFSSSGYVYVSDGSKAGTSKITGISGTRFSNDNGSASARVAPFKNGIAYFTQTDKIFDFYYHDGTTNKKLNSIQSGMFTYVYGLSEVSTGLLFSVEDPFNQDNNGLFVIKNSDSEITEILKGTSSYAPATVFTYNSSKAIFKNTSDGIYVTDGTAAGTIMLTKGRIDMFSGAIIPHAVVGDKVVFHGDEDFFTQFIYVTDGTLAGTKVIAEMDDQAYLSPMISSGNRAFWATGTTNGFTPELWMADITNNSSAKLFSFTEETNTGPNLAPIVVMDNKYYFNSTLKGDGRELYALSSNLLSAGKVRSSDPGIELIPAGGNSFKIRTEMQNEKYTIQQSDLQGRILKTEEVSNEESFELEGNGSLSLINIFNKNSSAAFKVFLK